MDADLDCTGDECDLCPGVTDYDRLDSDGDGFGDICDNCPLDANTDQLDADGDRIGDVCDPNTKVRGGGSRCQSAPGPLGTLMLGSFIGLMGGLRRRR